MRTRLFRAFLFVILTALLSNVISQWLIVKDFDRYVQSVKSDQFRWVLASLESSYLNGQWDLQALSESLHWAMMLGIEAKIVDTEGREVLTLQTAVRSLSDPMKHEMAGIYHLNAQAGPYHRYPLSVDKKTVGTLLFRPFSKKEIAEREEAFKDRSRYSLYVSLLMAGGSALLLAYLLSRYLSGPITNLKEAAQRIARGDLETSVQVRRDQRNKNTPHKARRNREPSDEIETLAESFNFMAKSLRREETLRRRLLANIAHELRTPLTIMKNHLEALEDGILEDPSAALAIIRNETEKLIHLIGGIEDLTLAEASFLKKGEFVSLNLNDFFTALLGQMLPLAREKGLTLERANDRDLIVTTDVEKLEKILRNLLSNALKFTEAGGIRIDYGRQEENFFIEIRDTGTGIHEEHLPFIFDRFYQAGGSESPRLGLGLGLAIVKGLVVALGGQIQVQSRAGKGTTFRVSLPLPPPIENS